ncbi:SHOCT domain-containing protein [Micropruina sp.]|uniref:SHOCT domain-containing protein n=1 Tax=Micropruina sp. TaxID=2737536 RepID=UPI0039E66AF9
MALFKTAAKVAVATSVHGKVRRRQDNRWAAEDQARAAAAQAAPPVQQYAPAPPVQQYAPPPPVPAPAAAPSDDVMQRRIAQLTQLAELRTAGILSDAEFEAQKAVILAS